MNKKEISELKKQFTPDNCTISRICGCYVDSESALEMTQNSERLSWTFEEVDAKLQGIMVNICHNMVDAAERYGMKGNYVAGANIAGFEKVVDAMNAQGIV